MTQLMEHINGTSGQRGRTVPALPQHTFRDTGITIGFRKVGPATQQSIAQRIMRDMPEPQPPMLDTELGQEANPADPAYIAAKAKWDQEIRVELSRRTLLIAAVEADVVIDDRARADIARRKRSLELAQTPYEPDPNLNDEENERVFFIMHVAAGTPDDLTEFASAVLRRSVPTEEAVQAQIATFQRDL
jgi:hypothetical protein